MGVDKEVVIPARVEFSYDSVDELKSQIDSILKEYRAAKEDLRNNDSKRGQSERLKKVRQIEAAEREIERIQSKITALSKEQSALKTATPESELKKTENRIAVIDRQIQATKDSISQMKDVIFRASGTLSRINKGTKDLRAATSSWKEEQKKVDAIYNEISKEENRQAQLIREKADLSSKILDLSKDTSSEAKEETKAYKEQRRVVSNSISDSKQKIAMLKEEAKAQGQLANEALRRLSNEEAVQKQKASPYEDKIQNATAERSNQEYQLKKLQEQRDELAKQAEYEREIATDESRRGEFADMIEADEARISKELDNQIARLNEKVRATDELVGLKRDEANAESSTTGAVGDSADKIRDQSKATKNSSAQWYYLARSMSMVKEQLSRIKGNIDKVLSSMAKAGKLFISPFKAFADTIGTLPGKLKASKSASDSLNSSFQKGVTAILRYGLGIRSLFVLFNKLRRVGVESLQQLALRTSHVNTQMSSIYSSFAYMKSAVATAVQPLLNVLVPALESVSAMFATAAYHIGSFFATLTGQSFVYRAMRPTLDYATDIAGMTGDASDNLDDAADNAKDLKKQLSGLDKLNVLTTDKDKDKDKKDKNSGKSPLIPGYSWEEVPLSQEAVKWAEKFKDILSKLFDPIKKAWDKKGKDVIAAWKYALEEIKKLLADIGRDFLTMWADDATVRMFENIFDILKDIGLIVGNIASKLREAWNHNNNGLRIFRAIRDCLLSITEHVKNITDFLVKWTDEISFVPMFDALADVLEKRVVPAVDKLGQLIEDLTIDIIDTLGTYVIETGIPKIIRAIGDIIGSIGNIAENFDKAWNSADRGRGILEKIRDNLLNPIVETIRQLAGYTYEWSKNLDFTELLRSIDEWLNTINGPMSAILQIAKDLYETIVLGFVKYLVEHGLPKLFDKLSEINQSIDWDLVNERVHKLSVTFEHFMELAWETFVAMLGDLGKAFKAIVESDAFGRFIDWIDNWVTNKNPEELAREIEILVASLLGLKLAVSGLSGLATIVESISKFAAAFKNLGNFIGPVATKITELVGELSGFASTLSGMPVEIGAVETSVGALATAISTVVLVIAGLITNMTGFFDSMKNGFSVGSELAMVFGSSVFGAMQMPILALENLLVAINNYPVKFGNMINEFGEKFGNLWSYIDDFRENLIENLENIGENFGREVGKWIGNAIDAFSDFPSKFKVWADTVDWFELGKNILLGILQIFFLPNKLLTVIVDAIATFVSSFIKGLCDGFKMGSPSKLMEPYGEDIFKGILNGILSAISGIVSWIKTNVVDPIVNAVGNFINVNTLVQKGKDLITGFKNGVNAAWAVLKNTLKNVWNKAKKVKTINASTLVKKGKQLINGFKNGVNAVKATLYKTLSKVWKKVKKVPVSTKSLFGKGKQLINGFRKGVNDGWSVLRERLRNIWSNIKETARARITAESLKSTGMRLINGFRRGVNESWRVLSERLRNIWKSVKDGAKNRITVRSLYSAGANLIRGLVQGIKDAWNTLREGVTSVFNSVTESAKNVFRIQSPSKVFMEIGEFIVEGLVQGMSEDEDEATNAFDNLVPGLDSAQSFADRLVQIFDQMRQDSISIVDSMIVSINDSLSKLSDLESIMSISNNLANIKIPDIAEGKTLPSSSQFSGSVSVSNEPIDLSELSSIIKDAMIEALLDPSVVSSNTDDEVIVQIDGKNVFEAMRSQNTAYKKRTGGVSAFA